MAQPQPVILDTDPGVDDALAILLALRSPELHVVGITTVCGNVPVEQGTQNLYRLLSLHRSAAPPLIGQGAKRPLRAELHTATQVHGSDGLGDLGLRGNGEAWWRPELDVPPDLPSALTVWQQGLRQYPDSLTLITLGPLTNLAQALEEAPALPSTFRRIICMGGAVAAPGNVTSVAEFNVFVDPHAARRVFEAGLPLTLVPLDVTMRTTLSREAIQSLTAEARSPVLRFLREATEPVILFTEQVQGRSVLELHDPLAVGVAIDPTLVTLHPLFVTVETEGRVTRGMTVADRRGLRPPYKSPANAEVALSVDIPRFLTLFQERLCRS